MFIKVEWFKTTGKWAYLGRVEVDALPYETEKVLLEIIKNQKEITDGWEQYSNYYVVVSDIPESENDPNYRMTYSRLYMPEYIKEIVANAK